MMHSTERAAMRLALGVLRRSLLHRSLWPKGAARSAIDHARHVLDIGYTDEDGGACQSIVGPLMDAQSDLGFTGQSRHLRARLALYLRAVLRAELWTTAPSKEPPR